MCVDGHVIYVWLCYQLFISSGSCLLVASLYQELLQDVFSGCDTVITKSVIRISLSVCTVEVKGSPRSLERSFCF